MRGCVNEWKKRRDGGETVAPGRDVGAAPNACGLQATTLPFGSSQVAVRFSPSPRMASTLRSNEPLPQVVFASQGRG